MNTDIPKEELAYSINSTVSLSVSHKANHVMPYDCNGKVGFGADWFLERILVPSAMRQAKHFLVVFFVAGGFRTKVFFARSDGMRNKNDVCAARG